MRKAKNLRLATTVLTVCAMFLAGCSNIGAASGTEAAAGSGVTISTGILSEESPSKPFESILNGSEETGEETAEATEQEETPQITEVTTNLPMLQPKENYIQPKSLDGIDPLNDKVVALTFDDGPSPYTEKLLDILEENDVNATFFLVGQNIGSYPDTVKRMYENGNEIGTHSWSHADLKKLSLNEIMVDEYGRANDVLEEIIGLRALIDRPPYGSMSTELSEEIGRAQILWSVDPEDWRQENRDPDTVYNNVVNGTENGGYVTDGAIVLSHDIHESTVNAYDRIIKALKDQGYKFVTVTQLMQIAEARGQDVGYRFANAQPASQSGSSED